MRFHVAAVGAKVIALGKIKEGAFVLRCVPPPVADTWRHFLMASASSSVTRAKTPREEMKVRLITSYPPRGVSPRSYVTGVDHTVAKSDEQLLAGAVAAALNKAEEEKLASVSGRFPHRMELAICIR